ncbi:exopolysaccharide biosynthesis polyprenyl glycosylphosphotransferase [Microvirga pakistanensis]|uniref:exopolysaccharide biosynthesis polyprenyl glycosylphosphotransferase n=1 Tax=Microvirga pakistanensis TaxID=1682650 RepID=UPI00141B22EB|nr:exopolysaccharide biosynthesis polyprenyl glycosylphosphotransferase [Microvirga pakistanensis]
MGSIKYAGFHEPLSAYGPGGARVRPDRISAYPFAASLLVADAVILLVSGLAPVLLYENIDSESYARYIQAIIVTPFIQVLSSQAVKANAAKRIFDLQWSLQRGVASVLLTFAMLMVIGVATKTTVEYSRVWFFSWVILSVSLMVAARILLLAWVGAKLANGACLQRALIVSCGDSFATGRQLALETARWIRPVGAINVSDLDSTPDLAPYLKQLSPDVVILCIPLSQIETALRKFKALSQHAVEVLVLPQAALDLRKAIRLRRIGDQTLLQIAEPPLTDWDITVKRIEDVVVASLALVLLSPLMLLTALAIRLDSRGPVLFRQTRAGFNGQTIELWKFRSMYVEASDPHASRQTSKRDPRVTRVGRFIRRTSIDELPQLWNVLEGKMSVVGPRPHALATSAEGKALDALVEEYVSRHRVKPGITGWAQVNGARGELRSREQVKRRVDYDLHYIENWSLLFDFKIILMTAVRMWHDPRAY